MMASRITTIAPTSRAQPGNTCSTCMLPESDRGTDRSDLPLQDVVALTADLVIFKTELQHVLHALRMLPQVLVHLQQTRLRLSMRSSQEQQLSSGCTVTPLRQNRLSGAGRLGHLGSRLSQGQQGRMPDWQRRRADGCQAR